MGDKYVEVTDAQIAAQKAIIALGFEPFGDAALSIYKAIENAPRRTLEELINSNKED